MHETSHRPGSPAEPSALRRHLLRTALVVLVLGVLPFALHAHPIFQLLGALVSSVLLASSAVLVWRTAFSTDPRHLARY